MRTIRNGTIFVAIVALLPATVATAAGTSEAELKALAEEIGKVGERWAAGEEPSELAIDEKLKAVTYTKDNTLAVKRLMAQRHKPPVGLYVTNKLIQPALQAPPEVIQDLLITVRQQALRARIRPFRKYPASALAGLNMPEYRGDVPASRILADTQRVQKMRDRKLAEDFEVARHNTQAARLQRNWLAMMFFAQEERLDNELIQILRKLEHEQDATFLWVVDLISAEADRLGMERAKRFYGFFKEMGLPVKNLKKAYRDYTEPTILPAGNSYYTFTDEKPLFTPGVCIGVKLLTAANQLAPKAKEPALAVPSEKSVQDRYHPNSCRLKEKTDGKR